MTQEKPSLIISVIIGIILITVAFGFVAYKLSNKWREYWKDQSYLSKNMQTELPKTPLEQAYYPVKSYNLPGECLVGASIGLAEYLEPEIDFDTYMLYTIPTHFGGGRDERYGPGTFAGVWCAFRDLGYTVYRGSPNPTHPPRTVIPCIEPENLITFKNSQQEFEFIQKLLSAGIIPIVSVKELTMGVAGPGGSFVTLTGYDQNNVWLNWTPVGADLFNPQTVTINSFPQKQFFKAWGVKNMFGIHRGGFEFFWLDKTGEIRHLDEIIKENKQHLQQAPENIQLTINYLEENKHRPAAEALWLFTGLGVTDPLALSRFWLKRGEVKLSKKYYELAKLYDEYRMHSDSLEAEAGDVEKLIEGLKKIKALTEEIVELWP